MADARCAFHWTEEYRVNIATLDQQPQGLFDAVNELERALHCGEGNTATNGILDKLVAYAALHFAAEESLMERHAFPGLSPHRLQHEKFRKQVATYLEEYRAGKSGVPVELLLFLQGWLKGRVLKTDKLYSAFLNARGVR